MFVLHELITLNVKVKFWKVGGLVEITLEFYQQHEVLRL